MSLNKVMLIGNVGKDPEVRYLNQQAPAPQPGQPAAQPPKVATIVLATSERYRDRNGQTQEHTEWHNIVAWRGLATVTENYIRKGTQIYVEGRLRTRSYQDASGNTKYTTEIIADDIQLLGRKSDNPASQAGGWQGQQPAQPQQPGYQAPAGGYAPKQGFSAQQQPAGFQPQAYTGPGAGQPTAPAIDDNPSDDLPF